MTHPRQTNSLYQWPSLDGAQGDPSTVAEPIAYGPYLREWLATSPPPADSANVPDGHHDDATFENAVSVSSVVRLNRTLLARDAVATPHSTDPVACTSSPAPVLSANDMVHVEADRTTGPPAFTLTPAQDWHHQLNSAVQWLCSGVSAVEGPRHALTTQTLAQRAVEHVMLTAPRLSSEDPGTLLDAARFGWEGLFGSPEPPAVPSGPPSVLPPLTRLRPAMVLMLFHRTAAVRVWARERLLDSVYAASQLRMPHDAVHAGSCDGPAAQDVHDAQEKELRVRGLWVVACQLLCVLKHLCQTRLPLCAQGESSLKASGRGAAPGEPLTLIGEGVYHAWVVLTVLDQRLTAAVTAATAPAPGSPAPPHRAMPLLLGGTLLLYWLSPALDELAKLYAARQRHSTPTSRGGAAATGTANVPALQQAAADLTHGLNHQLRHDRTLQPVSLATDTRKSIVKVLVHGLLDNAKVGDGSEAAGTSGSRRATSPMLATLREARMRHVWLLANSIEAPPTATTTTAEEPLGTRCAGWMLEPLLRNAAAQLDLKAALDTAMLKPANHSLPSQPLQQAARGGGGVMGLRPYVRPGSTPTTPAGAGDRATGTAASSSLSASSSSAVNTTALERAVQGYHLLLQSLLDAIPAFVTSPLLHGVLGHHQQDLVSLGIGGILHRASPDAVRLLSLLMRVDLAVFSASDTADPTRVVHSSDTTTPTTIPSNGNSMGSHISHVGANGGASGRPTMGCLERVWENFPKVLRYAIDLRPQAPPSAAGGPTSTTTAASAPHVLVQLAEALAVLVDNPAADRWLLMASNPCKDGPAPLAWRVDSCVGALLEVLRARAKLVQQQWESASPGGASAALSRLLERSSPLLRLVARLTFARSMPLKHLGVTLGEIFLHGLAIPVRATFLSDAAEWIWTQVVLPHPLLLGHPKAQLPSPAEDGGGGSLGGGSGPHWLQLHDPKVDNLARGWGLTWLPLLIHCNWSSESLAASPTRVASAWWLCALIADVVTVDSPRDRQDLLEKVVTQLPTPACFRQAETGGGGGDAALATALYAVLRHLLLSLLDKFALYPAEQLVAAVLYLAGVLPAHRAETDAALRSGAKACLMRLSTYVGLPAAVAAHRENRAGAEHAASPASAWLQYGPAWLVRAVQEATASVDECLADQERRLRQFEWEEKAAKSEEATTQQRSALEVARMAAAEAMRARRLQRAMEQQRAALPVQGLAALDAQIPPQPQPHAPQETLPNRSSSGMTAVAGKRERDAAQIGAAQALSPRPGVGAGWLSEERGGKRPDPFNDPIAAPLAASASAGQLRRQEASDRHIQKVTYAQTEDEVRARLLVVVGRTNLLQDPPAVGDIIGKRPGCLAPEVPVLPEIFVSRQDAAHGPLRQTLLNEFGLDVFSGLGKPTAAVGAVYAKSFIPHVALELRYGIVQDFQDCAADARRHGYFTESDRPKQGKRGDAGGGAAPTPAQDAASRLRHAFPLSRWVAETSACVTLEPKMGSGRNHHLDPERIDFVVASHVNAHARGGSGSGELGSYISDNDVVLVMLPLAVVLPAWFRYTEARRVEGKAHDEDPNSVEDLIASIPAAWRDFGCFPQVCYISQLGRGRASTTTLSTYPVHRSHDASRKKTKEPRAATPPSIPFLHALRLGFTSSDGATSAPKGVLYLRRLGSLGQAFTSVQALFGIHQTPFASTLYDPRTSAERSKLYYSSFRRFLFETPNTLRRLRSRLVHQGAVNDGQVTAIAAALYSTVPRWDEGPALTPDSNGVHGTSVIPLGYYTSPTNAVTNETPRFMQGPLPEILIVEGPPGTGKTQTIGVLTLNLLHYLPRSGRLLLCAPSNCAVDEALMRVRRLQRSLLEATGTTTTTTSDPNACHEQAELLRVGVRENVGEDVLSHSPPIFVDDKAAALAARQGHGKWGAEVSHATNAHLKQEVIQSAPIVFSTLGSLNHIQRHSVSFDVVIIDEASQATEPEILQALMLAKKRCILVGDSKQLQPTILCNAAAQAGLKRSLLVRLLSNGHESFVLRTQFRMHRDICYFPNQRYYQGRLRTDASVDRRSLVDAGQAALTQADVEAIRAQASDNTAREHKEETVAQKLRELVRFAFVHVSQGKMERGRGHSYKNVAEARAVVAYMRQLRTFLRLRPDEFAAHIGIITFYRAQLDAIRAEMTKEERASGIQVATVDSFQGKEKDIILISCVRTLDDAQRRKLEQVSEALGKHENTLDQACASGGLGAKQEAVVDVDAMSQENEEEARRGLERDSENEENGTDVGAEHDGEGSHDNDESEEDNIPSESVSTLSPLSAVQAAKKLKVEAPGAAPTGASAELAASMATLRAYDDMGRRSLGFLVDRHRINVSLTRAKDMCLVFGHRPTLLAVAKAEVAALRLQHRLASPNQPQEGSSAWPGNDKVGAAAFMHGLAGATALHHGPSVAVAGVLPSVSSPTTVESSKQAVLTKLRLDDDDPLALAALVAHAEERQAQAQGREGADAGMSDYPVASPRRDDSDDSVRILGEDEQDATEARASVRAMVCEYPRDADLIEKLRLSKA